MKTIRFLREAAGWRLLPVLLFLLPAVAWTEEPAAKQPAKDPSQCELVVEGKQVERISLLPQQSASNSGVISLDVKPGVSMFLPQGNYSIWNIELQGGYRNGPDNEALTLTPDAVCILAVGTPLKSSVSVTRQGRFLRLEYQLLDAQGRKYMNSSPPRFVVYQGNRKIGSGTFEYG